MTAMTHPDSPQEREQIGWQLVPIYRDDSDGFFVTQAFIHCCSCGKAISGTGGPMTNAYCMDCLKDDER